MAKEPEFNCPICNFKLNSCIGSKTNKSGISMWCPNLECRAQEVIGYGTSEKAAFEIIIDKYTRKPSL